MTSFIKPLLLGVILCNTLFVAKSKEFIAQPPLRTERKQTTLAVSTEAEITTEITDTTETTESTESTEITTELPQTTESPTEGSTPGLPTDPPVVPPAPTPTPTIAAEITTSPQSKPKEKITTHPPANHKKVSESTTRPQSPTTIHITQTGPVKRVDHPSTETPKATKMLAPITTKRVTAKPATQAPTTSQAIPKLTTPKPQPTAAKSVVFTRAPAMKPSTPVKPLVTTRTPTTVRRQPEKTAASQPEGTSEGHGDSASNHDQHTPTSKPGLDTHKNDTSWWDGIYHNSIVSKLMLPVVFGIVVAVIIVCFVYGVRACKRRNRGRHGRHRKLMQNGKDHEMGGNFDRMKLLDDTSEDEF